MQVCIVGDDVKLAAVLQRALEQDCSVPTHLESGEGAAHFIASQPFDAAVLDLSLSDPGGLVVIEHMRRMRCQTPVLVLSTCDTVPEMVRALDAGADDYMVKPFHLDLFLARLRSVARRGAVPRGTTLVIGPVALHSSRRAISLDGQSVELTRREYMLLETLMRRAGQVVTRDQLTTAVWGYAADVSKNNLDYHMHSLRAKLGPVCEGMIRTIRGIGYLLGTETAVA